MADDKKIAQYNAEMAEHANGAAQYLGALIAGRFVTREQARDMADYVLAQTKRNIERWEYKYFLTLHITNAICVRCCGGSCYYHNNLTY